MKLPRLLIAFVIACQGVTAVDAQDSPNLEATVTAIETKGKTTTLTVTDTASGTEYKFQLTPKVELEIVADGDDGFLAEGVMVRATATESNNLYFATTFSVYPQYAGKALPAKVVKAPAQPGQSRNAYLIAGEIVALEDPAEEKYDILQLKVNPKTSLPVYVEPNHKVRVVLTEPSSIKEGQKASVTGRVAGTKILPSKIVIETGESLKGAEFLPTVKK